MNDANEHIRVPESETFKKRTVYPWEQNARHQEDAASAAKAPQMNKPSTPYLDNFIHKEEFNKRFNPKPSILAFEAFIYIKAAICIQIIGTIVFVVYGGMLVYDGKRTGEGIFLWILLAPVLLRLSLEAGVVLFRIYDRVKEGNGLYADNVAATNRLADAINELVKRVDAGGNP